MNTRTKRSQRDYSLTFKLSVVAQIEKGELTYKQAQKRYGIQGRSTVLVWLRKHGQQNWSTLSLNSVSHNAMKNKAPLPQTPEQRIKELETELKHATEKAALFEAMLDVIRDEYGVRLPKKPSGGSSNKKK